MLNILLARLQQKHRTMAYPDGPAPAMPERFRGRPVIDAAKCQEGCSACADACPTDAIRINGVPRIDLGRCLFCTDCLDACPSGALSYSTDYRLAVRGRDDLVVDGAREMQLATALDAKLMKLFGRSLKLRQVCAGGCNGCESDVNVLNTVGWDIGRFGIQFVASPRHADGLLITGPVTQNMKLALQQTYEAVPDPKIVIAVGACAIAGGPYIDHSEVNNGAGAAGGVVPVDLFIPGCPPHPLTILDGMLRLLGKIEARLTP
ncbi:MAG TPA: 4Fe-4S dicluster domain-containing protein [Tepidisphaeraceae bacterium]|jgi:Ni,Fe-hydrogenase III small subunit/NAD-dependent dihydropyrimidine dehydrogenase PreA subunit